MASRPASTRGTGRNIAAGMRRARCTSHHSAQAVEPSVAGGMAACLTATNRSQDSGMLGEKATARPRAVSIDGAIIHRKQADSCEARSRRAALGEQGEAGWSARLGATLHNQGDSHVGSQWHTGQIDRTA